MPFIMATVFSLVSSTPHAAAAGTANLGRTRTSRVWVVDRTYSVEVVVGQRWVQSGYWRVAPGRWHQHPGYDHVHPGYWHAHAGLNHYHNGYWHGHPGFWDWAAESQHMHNGFNHWHNGYNHWHGSYDHWHGGYNHWHGGYNHRHCWRWWCWDHWHGGGWHWHGGGWHRHGGEWHQHGGYNHWHGPFLHIHPGTWFWRPAHSHWHTGYNHWHPGESHWHAAQHHWHVGENHWHAPTQTWVDTSHYEDVVERQTRTEGHWETRTEVLPTPTITLATRCGRWGNNGWCLTPIDVTCTARDPVYAIEQLFFGPASALQPYTGISTLTVQRGDTTGETLACYARSADAWETDRSTVTFKVDTVPPLVANP